MIRENLQELAITMTRETGRPIKSSKGEIERTAQIFELASSEVRRVLRANIYPYKSTNFLQETRGGWP